MNLKKIDKKLYLYLGISVGVMLILIAVMLVIKFVIGNKVSFEAAENKIRNAAITYVEARTELLPIKGESTRIEFNDLVTAEVIKPFDKLLQDSEATCTAHVIIENNNENYLYTPYLDCGDKYQTTKLNDIIKTSGVVTSGEGLYEIEGNLVFRGEKLNNYIRFANKDWRIVRINNDGTIRLVEIMREDTYVWDDRYNSEMQATNGINDYRISRVKDVLDELYNNEKEFSKKDKTYLAKQNVCIGKRNENDTNLSNGIECSETLDNQYLSLIQINEYALASIDKNCTTVMNKECSNYNYLATFERGYWTITGTANRSDRIYKINKNVSTNIAASANTIRLVVNLSANTLYESGNGSEENPYKIKMA